MAPKKVRHHDVNYEVFERQAVICKAFANPTRLRLLDILATGEHGVSDLQKELGISKTNLSQHLAVLKNAGVVVMERRGKLGFCSLAMPEVKQACAMIRDVLRCHIREARRLSVR